MADLPTFILALAGAILGTYGAVMSTVAYFEQRRSTRPDVQVKMTHFLLSIVHPTWGFDRGICLKAGNQGVVSIVTTSVGLLLPNKMLVAFLKPNTTGAFPSRVEPGEAVEVFVGHDQIAAALDEQGLHGIVRLRAVFRDQAGREYRSKVMFYDRRTRFMFRPTPGYLWRRLR